MDETRTERLAEFLRRLAEAPAVASRGEAFGLLCRMLNEVEDALTSIPFDPPSWQFDKRLYPPQEDSAERIEGGNDIVRYRSRGHFTYIAANGAIKIEERESGYVVLQKPGLDGCGIG